MDCTRNEITIKKEIISFLKSLGIEVHTRTKAHGHQGFFKKNRIDVSRDIKPERVIPTLIHEFSHYIIYNIKPVCKDFQPIFGKDYEYIYDELTRVTNFVDNNSTLEKFQEQKDRVKESIKEYNDKIKSLYPKFKRGDKFKPFLECKKYSKIKHLEKYDAVKVIGWFSYKTYSIINLEEDFPDIPKEVIYYLKLRSCQRRQASLSRKMNKMNKYYREPTELFARFVEGLYLDVDRTKELAPRVFELFYEKYNNDYYLPLNSLFKIVKIDL